MMVTTILFLISDLKAVFAIETTVDEDLTVISNMPIMDSRCVK